MLSSSAFLYIIANEPTWITGKSFQESKTYKYPTNFVVDVHMRTIWRFFDVETPISCRFLLLKMHKINTEHLLGVENDLAYSNCSIVK